MWQMSPYKSVTILKHIEQERKILKSKRNLVLNG